MFCSNCGKQLGPESNFCSACGTVVSRPNENVSRPVDVPGSSSTSFPDATASTTQTTASSPSWSFPEKLVRPRSPRILGGVCAAFALHFGWNLDLVRIITAVFGLFYGVGILAYIACWIILPDAPYALPSQSR